MTFNDIFKSSFLENVTAVSLLDMALALSLIHIYAWPVGRPGSRALRGSLPPSR